MEKNNEQQKEMTLDDLALMVARGFNEVNEKMDKRFNQVDGRLDKVDGRLDKVETRLDKVETRLGDIEANLNKKIDKIEHNTLTYRVEKLEEKFV